MPPEAIIVPDQPKKTGKVIRKALWSEGNSLEAIEIGFTLILTGFALIAHWQVLTHSGHLWRDEGVSITLARSPSLGALWHDLQEDSFPAVWPIVLRFWTDLIGADNDFDLRILAFVFGITAIPVLWFHARQTPARAPVLGMALVGLQSAVVYYGDAVRAYGLGLFTAMVAVVTMWRAVNKETASSWLIAFLAACLAVHSIFHNCAVVFASCVAASAVLLLRRQRMKCLIPLGVGFAAALTLLFYFLNWGNSGEWRPVLQYPFTYSRFWSKIADTFAETGTATMIICIVCVAIAVVMTISLSSANVKRQLTSAQREVLLFSGVAMTVGIASHFAFLRALSYFMQPWYFLTTLAIVGITIDGIATSFPDVRWRYARLGIGCVVAILCVNPLLTFALQLKSNISFVADEIQKVDQPGDLIIVNYWWLEYSFGRDYMGKADWITVPPLPFPHAPNELSLFGLKRQMSHPYDAMKPVIERSTQTLRSGKKLWIVGTLSIPEEGVRYLLPPPFTATCGYQDTDYYDYWSLEIGKFVHDHSRSVKRIGVLADGPVSSYENEPLYLIEGWRD